VPWQDDAADCAERKEQREFKVGDRVTTSSVSDAGVGVIIEVNDTYCSVDFKDTWYRVCGEPKSALSHAAPCPQDNEQPGGKMYVDEFKARLSDTFTAALGGTPQPCIVALIAKDGKPRPSSYPHVHASVAAATTEAERLARNNPGQEFAVYQRVVGRKAEVHVEMKEVA
jgi:hypothetical protein